MTVIAQLGKAGMGKVTIRTKEYPVVVYEYKGALILTTLRYAYEVVNPGDMEELSDLKSQGKKRWNWPRRSLRTFPGNLI